MIPGSYELTKEIDYLFASYLFCNKPQMKRLLSYLVQHCNDESESAFDQRAIATECLGRRDDFDPAENPVVRIEVGRLRRLLNRFYEEEVTRSIGISIPLGQYRPVIEEQLVENERGYLPELAATDAKPECLSLLLQFDTQGEESSELYLLRHQMRIGLTIDIGKVHGVRLVVALPNEEGSVSDSIDFVMRVVVSVGESGFNIESNILKSDSDYPLFSHNESLVDNYDTGAIQRLLHQWVSDYFDLQIGKLWPIWVDLRSTDDPSQNIPVNAMLLYHQFQIHCSQESLEKAMSVIEDAVKRYPGDQLLSFALADLYYRDVIHGFGVSVNPLTRGISHIREALRFDPGNPSLHTLLASMTFFSKEYDIAKMELEAVRGSDDRGYSFSFQQAVLQCLMGEWEVGINRISAIAEQFGRAPAIYPALEYINASLTQDDASLEKCRENVLKNNCQSTVYQCIRFMRFPKIKSVPVIDRKAFSARIKQHLEH